MACSGTPSQPGPTPPEGTTVSFDLSGTYADDTYWELPLPSDLRLDAAGAPDVSGFPNPNGLVIIDGLKGLVPERRGHALMPVGHARFDAALPPQSPDAPQGLDASAPIVLVDVDADSPERGRVLPIAAQTLAPDPYVPEHLLAMAPWPGVVLRGDTTYAFVVKTTLGDAAGEPLGVPAALASLRDGAAPEGPLGAAALELYGPAFDALEAAGVARDEVASLAVFTTGDIVRDTALLSTAVRDAFDVTIENVTLFDAEHPSLCELHAEVSYPQFQRGVPPFDSEGLFELGPDGLPIEQRQEVAPVVIAIPKLPMPEGGYRLEVFVHGSGGYSTNLIHPPFAEGSRLGPAHVMAPHGIAMAGSAMPVNPERLPGASEIAYVNTGNIPAVRDTFRQGVLEQRLFLEALETLTIDPQVLAACVGPSLPAGEVAYRFDTSRMILAGQSMGAWYTNLISAQEPLVKAIIPTGAGGHFPYFLLKAGAEQASISTLGSAVGPILFQTFEPVTFLHPAAGLFETGAEASDPIVFTPRVALRPLDGHEPRSIYEPCGKGDSYFNEVVFDAMALAYGNQQAGTEHWPGMQASLALVGNDGLASYPVTQNRTSETGASCTGVVVQQVADGDWDPHALYLYDEGVRHQYECFGKTFVETGVARVPAFGPLGSACD